MNNKSKADTQNIVIKRLNVFFETLCISQLIPLLYFHNQHLLFEGNKRNNVKSKLEYKIQIKFSTWFNMFAIHLFVYLSYFPHKHEPAKTLFP